MIKTVLLVPSRDNQGRLFPRDRWIELEEQLVTAFGGLSRESGIRGVWRDRGRVYRDVSRRYVVSLDSWLQLPAWLDMVRWALRTFEQEAL